MMNSNGIEISVRDRTADSYFVTDDDGVERETDEAGFIAMERRCGFRPKPGCGPLATGGFNSGNRSGRIEMPFDGPAKVIDGDTGNEEPADDCKAAFDRARELNAGLPRRRHYAQAA